MPALRSSTINPRTAIGQTEMDFFKGDAKEMSATARDEIATNLTAPATLSIHFLPLLARQPRAAIVNISSALAISPKKAAPVYCATIGRWRHDTTSATTISSPR